jgi:phosphonate transport system permease protein
VNSPAIQAPREQSPRQPSGRETDIGIAPFALSRNSKLALLALAIYVVYAGAQLDFNWQRLQTGLDNAVKFIGRMFPPNFERWDVLLKGIIESLQIAVLASALGISMALPLGLLGARNLMPTYISWPARALVALCRSLHPVIVAILFVKAVGFGALAGILSLAVASIGFIGKLFAEAIEEISMKQIEAVRATGASFPNLVAFGVVPQVLGRFVGFATYQIDSNLRNSTMVGIVGAGGVGGALFSAFQRFDYDFVCAILLTIIAIIMLGEVLANLVRSVFVDGASIRDLMP